MERIVFDNYDADLEWAKENLLCNDIQEEDITDNMLWDEWYECSSSWFDDVKSEIAQHLEGKTLMLFGSIGRWNGTVTGWETYDDFEKLLYSATKDCDYIKIIDDNGHLHIVCSHHDGNNSYEIKVLTDKGKQYLENWEYSWNDKRNQKYVGEQLVKRYTRLPRFYETVYGITKGA